MAILQKDAGSYSVYRHAQDEKNRRNKRCWPASEIAIEQIQLIQGVMQSDRNIVGQLERGHWPKGLLEICTET